MPRHDGSVKKKPVVGVAFPLNEGTRSSTAAGKAVWVRAARAAKCDEADALARAIVEEKDWRHKYVPHIVALTKLSLKSPADAVAVASEGLAAVRETFEFVPEAGGEGVKLQDAITDGGAARLQLHTGTFKGSGGAAAGLQVPLSGAMLSGVSLDNKVDEWLAYGCMEADAAAAIKDVVANPGKASLKGHCFVMIGVGSEMGPFRTLMQMGATVVGTGTRNPNKWNKVFDTVRHTSGVLMLPISRPQGDMTEEELAAAAGCDPVEDLPSLLPWLTENAFKFKKVTVGCYVYMDGEAHVRAAVAMDLIVTGLVASGKGKGVEVSVAYLGSPATCYPIPTDCHAAMAQARSDAPFWHHMVMPKPNAAEMDGDFCVFNGLSVLQGPNYALAKTMQMWRAVLLRSEGTLVSTFMAPACRTASMTSSATISAVLDGQAYFKPLLSFDSSTASPLLAALLLHDLFWSDSPAQRVASLPNPNYIFALKGFHGGMWRCAWAFESVGMAMAVLGRVWRYHPEGL